MICLLHSLLATNGTSGRYVRKRKFYRLLTLPSMVEALLWHNSNNWCIEAHVIRE